MLDAWDRAGVPKRWRHRSLRDKKKSAVVGRGDRDVCPVLHHLQPAAGVLQPLANRNERHKVGSTDASMREASFASLGPVSVSSNQGVRPGQANKDQRLSSRSPQVTGQWCLAVSLSLRCAGRGHGGIPSLSPAQSQGKVLMAHNISWLYT